MNMMLQSAAAVVTRSVLGPGLTGRKLPGPRSSVRVAVSPAVSSVAAQARAQGASNSALGREVQLGVVQDWVDALRAQGKALRPALSVSQRAAFEASDRAQPNLTGSARTLARWTQYAAAWQAALRARGVNPVTADRAVQTTIASGVTATPAPRTPAAAQAQNVNALKARVAALRAQGKTMRPALSVSQQRAFQAAGPGASSAAQWATYVKWWEDAIRSRGSEPTSAGLGSLGATGFAVRRLCSFQSGESGGSRGQGPRGAFSGEATATIGPTGPGPGGGPIPKNAFVLQQGTVGTVRGGYGGGASDTAGFGMGALVVQDPFVLTPARASSSYGGRYTTVYTTLPPQSGEGGGDGDTQGLGEDEIALGSWLSKALGKLGDKWNLPVKQLAPTAAAGGALAIPVIGPLISGAIGAVTTIAQSREATKQAEALAAQMQAQAGAQALAPQAAPPPTVVVQPATNTKKGGAGFNLPGWAIPAAIAGGAVLLLAGRRR